MIKDMKPLALYEVKEIMKKQEGKEEIMKFIKKFQKLDKEKAEKMKQELKELDLLKLKDKEIVKIIEILPEDAVDLNKIFTETSLNEDETNKILEIVKKYL